MGGALGALFFTEDKRTRITSFVVSTKRSNVQLFIILTQKII